MATRPRIAEDFFDATFANQQGQSAPSTSVSQTPPPDTTHTTAAPSVNKQPSAKSKSIRRSRPSRQVKVITRQNDTAKVRTTLYIREELHEKARWAILNLNKAPRSISQLIEGALEREIERLGKVNRTGIKRHRIALPGGRPRAIA